MGQRWPPRPVPAGHRLQQRERTVQGSVTGLIRHLGAGAMRVGGNDFDDPRNTWEKQQLEPLRVDD